MLRLRLVNFKFVSDQRLENNPSRNWLRTTVAVVLLPLAAGCLNTLNLKKIPAIIDQAGQNSPEGVEQLPALVEVQIPFEKHDTPQTLPDVALHVGQGLKIKISGEPIQREFGSDGAVLKLVRELSEQERQEIYLTTGSKGDVIDPNGEYLCNWHTIQEAIPKVRDNWSFQIVLEVWQNGKLYCVQIIPIRLQNYQEWDANNK